MGNFSNGTEGDCYEQEYCSKCRHFETDPEKPGCPVMGAHFLYAYGAKDATKEILDMLIPRDGAYNARCSTFIGMPRRKR